MGGQSFASPHPDWVHQSSGEAKKHLQLDLSTSIGLEIKRFSFSFMSSYRDHRGPPRDGGCRGGGLNISAPTGSVCLTDEHQRNRRRLQPCGLLCLRRATADPSNKPRSCCLILRDPARHCGKVPWHLLKHETAPHISHNVERVSSLISFSFCSQLFTFWRLYLLPSFQIRKGNDLLWSTWDPEVASSGFLSSLIRRKRGNRREMPFSGSTWGQK